MMQKDKIEHGYEYDTLPIKHRRVGIKKAKRLEKILHRRAMRKYQQDSWRILGKNKTLINSKEYGLPVHNIVNLI